MLYQFGALGKLSSTSLFAIPQSYTISTLRHGLMDDLSSRGPYGLPAPMTAIHGPLLITNEVGRVLKQSQENKKPSLAKRYQANRSMQRRIRVSPNYRKS